MSRKTLLEHQVLSFALARTGRRADDLTGLLDILACNLDCSGHDRKTVRNTWSRMAEAGHVAAPDGVIETGPGIHEAIAARHPARRPLTRKDLTPWIGARPATRINVNEPAAASPWGAAATAEILARRAEGRLKRLDLPEGRLRIADAWNRVVETGEITYLVQVMMLDALDEAVAREVSTTAGEADLEGLADRLNAEIAAGFSPVERPSPPVLLCRDPETGANLRAGIVAMTPVFTPA